MLFAAVASADEADRLYTILAVTRVLAPPRHPAPAPRGRRSTPPPHHGTPPAEPWLVRQEPERPSGRRAAVALALDPPTRTRPPTNHETIDVDHGSLGRCSTEAASVAR
jgi:hypothetical protein